MSKHRLQSIVYGVLGSGIGAGVQLLLLVYFKRTMPPDEFGFFVVASTLSISVAAICLFNQHADILTGRKSLHSVLRTSYLRIAAVTLVVVAFYFQLGNYSIVRSDLAYVFAFVFTSSVATATAQACLAHAIVTNNKLAEVAARSGYQILFFVSIIVAQSNALMTVLFLNSVVALCVTIGLVLCAKGGGKVRSNIAVNGPRSRREHVFFAANVISDGFAGPTLMLIWTKYLSATQAAELLFVYRVLNGFSGVIASGLSLHVARIFSHDGQQAIIGIARLKNTLFCSLGFLVIWVVFFQYADDAIPLGNRLTQGAVLGALIFWQLLVASVGANSMVPKVCGRQLEFSMGATLYNVVLIAAAFLALSTAGYFVRPEVAIVSSLLPPMLTMTLLLLWIKGLSRRAVEINNDSQLA